MANFCLLPEKVEEFKKALKSRELNIADLINMTTEERTKVLEKYAGENAKDVNTLFEQKLVLKNKILGIKNWASKVGEIGRYDPKEKAKLNELLEEYKAKQQERIFSPKEEEAFLNDLADQKLGAHISQEEAKNVFDLTTQTEDYKKAFDPETETWSSPEAKEKYGASKVALEKYVDELKNNKFTAKNVIKENIAEIKQSGFRAPSVAIGKTINGIANNSVALVATLDNSFLGRQGLHTLMTHPKIWWKGAANSFLDWGKTIKKPDSAIDAIMADVYSSPNYINGEYKLAKLIPENEEQYPTSLPERIPGVGRVFKGSNVAFTGSAIRMRTGLYDLLSKTAKDSGVKWDDNQIKDIGNLINSLTARGKIGKTGELGVVKLVLWAPRMLKGNYDVLTGHTLGQGLETAFARKQAALNWTKIIATSAAIITIANAIKPGSAETDPRSSDFGKIKIGNTRFDFSAGAGSLITLASRILTGKYKSSTTGQITSYGTKIGQKSAFDAVIDFLVGKENPPASVITDYLKGQNFQGKPPTLPDEIYRSNTPIDLQNLIKFKDGHSADQILGFISDFLGGSSNTYQDSNIKSGIIPENTKMSNQTFVDSVSLYAKAMGTDPETAFNRIFTGQKILKLSNGTIIVQRMSLADSQAVKKKYGQNTKEVKLDHTVPLEIGGSNDKSNLKMVSTATWSSYTPVENALGKALKANKISGKDAQTLIKKFKSISDSKARKAYGQNIISKYK